MNLCRAMPKLIGPMKKRKMRDAKSEEDQRRGKDEMKWYEKRLREGIRERWKVKKKQEQKNKSREIKKGQER